MRYSIHVPNDFSLLKDAFVAPTFRRALLARANSRLKANATWPKPSHKIFKRRERRPAGVPKIQCVGPPCEQSRAAEILSAKAPSAQQIRRPCPDWCCM